MSTKFIFTLVLVSVLAVVLSACGNGGGDVIGGTPTDVTVQVQQDVQNTVNGVQNAVSDVQNVVNTCKNAGDAVALLTDCVDAMEQVGQ